MGLARVALAIGVALGGAALTACGGDSASASDLWCDGYCSAAARCRFADPNCHPSCVRGRPGLAAISTSGAAAQEPCIANLSCGAVNGDEAAWKTEVDACWQKAKDTAAVTDHVRRFCDKLALLSFDCGSSYAIDQCQRDYAMWSDKTMDRVQACEAEATCDAVRSCEMAVFANPS